MKHAVVLLVWGVVMAQIIMTPIPEGKIEKYRDEAVVWPIPDETRERMVDRWLSNYCHVIEDQCPMLIPYWAGWGWQKQGLRFGGLP